MSKMCAALGGDPLDMVINNAGYFCEFACLNSSASTVSCHRHVTALAFALALLEAHPLFACHHSFWQMGPPNPSELGQTATSTIRSS